MKLTPLQYIGPTLHASLWVVIGILACRDGGWGWLALVVSLLIAAMDFSYCLWQVERDQRYRRRR